MRYVIRDAKYRFHSAFDTVTGAYVRTGILDDSGNDTGIDPFMASQHDVLANDPDFSQKEITK